MGSTPISPRVPGFEGTLKPGGFSELVDPQEQAQQFMVGVAQWLEHSAVTRTMGVRSSSPTPRFMRYPHPMYKDPAEQAKYQREWMKRRRQAWLQENGPCRSCGSEEALEVDHIDPSKKVTHNVWSWSKTKRERELSKCQVLCRPCHKRKTTKERRAQVSHGTEWMHRKYKCRCPLCKEWKRQKSAREYQRRKQAGVC